MNVAVIEPVVDRLRQRRSRVQADSERLASDGTRPAPVGELLASLEEELCSLLSLGKDYGVTDPLSLALRIQHQGLRQHAESLGSLLDLILHFETSAAPQRASAQVLLADFARELCDHLSFEEQNGCLQRAAEAAPRFARRVDALFEEHRTFRRRSWLLATLAQEAGPDVGSWEPLRKEFGELCEALRLHEELESDVLHGAYQVDLGGSG